MLFKPDIILRSQWGATLPEYNNPNYKRYIEPIKEVLYGIVLHHSAALTSPENIQASKGFVAKDSKIDEILRSDQAWHLNLGYGDYSYHYAVDPNGRIYQGREIFVRGCHVAGGNTGRLGVCALGNYETQEPTEELIEGLVKLFAWYSNFLTIQNDQIQPHSFFNPTACPGKNLIAEIPKIKFMVKELLKVK